MSAVYIYIISVDVLSADYGLCAAVAGTPGGALPTVLFSSAGPARGGVRHPGRAHHAHQHHCSTHTAPCIPLAFKHTPYCTCTCMRGRGGASLQASVATLRHYRPGLRPGTFKKKKKSPGGTHAESALFECRRESAVSWLHQEFAPKFATRFLVASAKWRCWWGSR